MGNTIRISSDFYCLPSPQQKKILEACMDNKLITWATVARLAAPAMKDQQFLAKLIESYKNGTAVPTTPPPRNQGTSKRPKTSVTPEVMEPPAFPSYINTDDKRQLFTEMLQIVERILGPIDASAPPAVAINNPAVAINTTDGNKYKSTAWANIHLAPDREKNWVCTSGPGPSSFYSNPTKAVRTLFNWHQIVVSNSDVSNIKYITSLKNPELLAASIQEAFRNKGVTLERGNKDFADVFACTDPEPNPILIVALARVHAKCEKDEEGTPRNENFTALFLIYQSAPHVILLFSGHHTNLHLGTMCRDKDYKRNGTFNKYMSKNVNHKLVPIHKHSPGNHTIERELQLVAYYTTSRTTTNPA